MKLPYILCIALTTLLLTSCSTSTITYNKSNINVQVDNTLLQVHGTQLKSKRENFSILYLKQTLLRLDDGSMVMYEYARTDNTYEFANNTRRTIDIIFDARKIIEVYSQSLLYAYQIVLTDGRILNAIVSQSYDQELTLVYGMSSEKLDKMIKKLNPKVQTVPYRNTITITDEEKPLLSKWTTWKINFTPLVQPLPQFISI